MASAEVTKLVIGVDSTAVRKASGDLNELAQAGGKAETAADSMAQSYAALGKVLGPIAAAFSVSQIIEAADAYTNLQSRIKLVTQSATDYAEAQQAVIDISQRTRVGLQQTGDLFTSLARATQSIGASQSEVLGVVESINKALIVSGTSAQSAAAALTQLGQGFSAGVLRGEELNSILEQAPRLAKAIADGLGVPVGKLRELGAEGQLTADKVFSALQKAAQGIQSEFEQMPLTVGQAFTQAGNSVSVLIGAIDKATGATSGLAEIISDASKFMSEMAVEIERVNKGMESSSTAANIVVTAIEAVRVLFANVAFVLRGVGNEIGGIAAQVAALARLDLKGFTAISDAMKADAARARAELDKLEREILTRRALPEIGGGRAARMGETPTVTGGTPKKTTGGVEKISEAERYLQRLQDQLRATEKLTVTEILLDDIQRGRLGKVTKAQETALVAIAKEIDLKKQLLKDEQIAAQIAQNRADARNKENEEANRVVERNMEADRSRLEGLLALTDSSKLKRQTDDIMFLYKAWQEGINGVTLSEEQYTEAVKARLGTVDEATKKGTDAAKDLGMTFASAFEDAILSGKKLSDVLGGLAQDVARIFIRKSITEPLAGSISGLFEGFSFGSLFGLGKAIGGPVSAGKIYPVNERGPELLSVGGRDYLMMGSQSGNVTPNAGGSISIVQNISMGEFATPSMVREQVDMGNARLMAALSRAQRTGR